MTNNTGIIDTGKNPDLLTFAILIDNTEIPGTFGVRSVAVRKEINRIANARVVLNDGNAATQDFPISDGDLFVPGKKIEIQAGYHSDNKTIFKGIIIRHSVKAKSSGMSSLIIECRDEAVKMTVGRKSNYFYDSTDSEVFDELISKYQLEKSVRDTAYTHEKLVQFNASDWDFLVSRAQANGLLCFTNDGKLTIDVPDVTGDPVETITYGMNVRNFEAEIDARTQFSKVSAYSWNQADQEISMVESDDAPLDLAGNLSQDELAAVIGLENLELKHGGNLSNVEAQDWANSKMLFQQLARVRGRVCFQGTARVKPGVIIKLEGVGNRFSGKVYVTGVMHTLVNGDWTSDVQFGLNPVWFSETFDITETPASGLLPAVKGLQYGVVTQLQDDPKGEYRVLVKLPIVNDSEQGIWCRMATLDAGDNRGSFFYPEIGDEVVVGFINEDPNDAVIVGKLNSSAHPAPLTPEDANNVKGFVTRGELKFLFDDDKKSVTLETPAGKKISVDENADEIRMEDEHGNTVILTGDGISLESKKDISIKAGGDVSIEGMNISLDGQGEVKASGTAGTELSSTATTIVKGSIVQIN